MKIVMKTLKQLIIELMISSNDRGQPNFSYYCPQNKQNCQNAGSVFQTEEGVTILGKTIQSQGLKCTGSSVNFSDTCVY